MSDWITDRLPTYDEAVGYTVLKWHKGQPWAWAYNGIKLGEPWQPIPKPAPYVKPKRWTVEWDNDLAMWKVISLIGDRRKVAASLWCLSWRKDHADAAQRIADIYNEELP